MAMMPIGLERQGCVQKLPLLVSILGEPKVGGDAYPPYPSLSFLSFLDSRNRDLLASLQQQEAASSELYAEIQSQLQSLRKQRIDSTLPFNELSFSPGLIGEEKPAFALRLVACPKEPLYILRRYSFTFRLVPCSSRPLPQSIFCVLSLRESKSNNAEIKLTRKGNSYIGTPFLSGQLAREFHCEEELVFTKIVFNDITKGLPNGRVNLMLKGVGVEGVRPITVEGIRVKARRKRIDKEDLLA